MDPLRSDVKPIATPSKKMQRYLGAFAKRYKKFDVATTALSIKAMNSVKKIYKENPFKGTIASPHDPDVLKIQNTLKQTNIT